MLRILLQPDEKISLITLQWIFTFKINTKISFVGECLLTLKIFFSDNQLEIYQLIIYLRDFQTSVGIQSRPIEGPHSSLVPRAFSPGNEVDIIRHQFLCGLR